MATYKLMSNGVVTYHNCESMIQAIAIMKATGKGGTIKKVEEIPVQPKDVVVTCGYGKAAHKWTTTKDQAIRHKNTCPNHRSVS